MHLAVILIVMIPHICFASPFDLANDQDEEVIEELEEVQAESIDNAKSQVFHSVNKAEIIAVNIKNGNRYTTQVNVGDSTRIDKLNLKLNNCSLEKDHFYKRISLAEVALNGEKFVISNDSNIRNIVRGDILLLVKCL
jgi:hypothetical protein